MAYGDDPPNALYACVGAFVDELGRADIQNAVICPGSRSTPLALALAADGQFRIWMQVDERSAAFFALGLAKATERPIALVCTSGTAAANFLPAIAEAHLTHVPLVVLTADRPHELRDDGAPQTIDQIRLYGTHVKWFMDLPLPEATNEGLRFIRTIACRAVATARNAPGGPVHLNFPFREPLTPDPGPLPPLEQRDPVAWKGRKNFAPFVWVSSTYAMGELSGLFPGLFRTLRSKERGLIVVGPSILGERDIGLKQPNSLYELAQHLDYPILVDPLSGMRRVENEMLISSYDAFLRDERFVETYAPEVVIRIGAMPTSKALTQYLKRYPACQHIVIGNERDWMEPTQLATIFVSSAPGPFTEKLLELFEMHKASLDVLFPMRQHPSSWMKHWMEADVITKAAIIDTQRQFEQPFEGRIFTELADLCSDSELLVKCFDRIEDQIPEQDPASVGYLSAKLVVGNSMPIRDADTLFAPTRHVRIFGNRGANGIDGVISTALGVSAGSHGPIVLVIGDLSFYHDMNGLLAAKLHRLDLTIVLINNDGGGIFSFLPQANYPEHFEQLLGTPTGLDFAPAIAMYGGRYTQAQDWPTFRAAVTAGMEQGGLHVVEVRTDRAANVTMHRALWPAVGRALVKAGIVEAAQPSPGEEAQL